MLGPRTPHGRVAIRAGIRIGFNTLFSTATSTSLAPERGPCRKPSGGGPGRKSLPLKDLTPHRPTWRRREHLSGYRSRQAQARASGAIRVLGWKPSETGKNRPPTGHLGLFGPFSHVVTIDRGNLRAAREGFHSEPTNGFLPLSGQKSSNLRPGGKTPRWRSGLYFKRAEFWHRTGSGRRLGVLHGSLVEAASGRECHVASLTPGAFVGAWFWIDNDYLEPLTGQAITLDLAAEAL